MRRLELGVWFLVGLLKSKSVRARIRPGLVLTGRRSSWFWRQGERGVPLCGAGPPLAHELSPRPGRGARLVR